MENLKNRYIWETAQWVKYLSCKHEELSSVPRTHFKELGMVACSRNPTSGDTQTNRALLLASHSSLIEELKTMRDSVSKKEDNAWETIPKIAPTPTHTCIAYMCMYTQTYAYTYTYIYNTCLHIHICIYTHMCLHIHQHVYTCIQTHTKQQKNKQAVFTLDLFGK